ncbi:hypothetical protein BH23VER1_BH23VER1_26680 [soil metagenome]
MSGGALWRDKKFPMAVTNKKARRAGAEWRGGAVPSAGAGVLRYLNRVLALGFLVGVIAVCAVAIWPEIQRQKVLDREIAELESARQGVEARRNAVRTELGWLRYDPSYLELIARDRFDLYKPGEVIIHIDRRTP